MNSLNDKYPPFQLTAERYDQATFLGRLYRCLDLIDPRTLFVTKKQLSDALQLLKDFEDGKIATHIVSNKKLWECRKIKDATIHPDTSEKIFMPFRMSGYVPFGSPIVLGLLLPNQTFPQMIFWQWLNQSHNACVNYANRNATKPCTMSTFAQGYFCAATAAVSISVGLSHLVRRAKQFSLARRMLIERFVPYPAVATASVLNVVFMRKHEISQGIEVLDKDGKIIGTSQIAAKNALFETAITRAVLPAPVFLIPPAILTQLEKTKWLKSHPKWHLPINAFLVTVSFAFALPVAIAMFPQTSQILRDKLEPHLQSSTSDTVLYYNKGL